MTKAGMPSVTLKPVVVTATNPHPERHAGIVQWQGRILDVPLRFAWAKDHAATTIRPGAYRKWDEAVGIIAKFALVAASAPIGGWLGLAVRAGIAALPNDVGKNASPHSRIMVPQMPVKARGTQTLGEVIKALKIGVEAVKSKLEECLEENRKAGPATGRIEKANQASMEELCKAYQGASNLLKWAGIVPLAVEYLVRPNGSSAFGLVSQLAASTLSRIESVALKAIAQNETAMALLSKRAVHLAMQENEWLGTAAHVAKAGGFIIQVGQLFFDLYNIGNSTAAETVLELTFNTVAMERYNSWFQSRFQAGNICWYLQLHGVSSVAETEAYFAVLYDKVKMKTAPLLVSEEGVAKIWSEVVKPGGYIQYSMLWGETTSLDVASTRPSRTYADAIDIDFE